MKLAIDLQTSSFTALKNHNSMQENTIMLKINFDYKIWKQCVKFLGQLHYVW